MSEQPFWTIQCSKAEFDRLARMPDFAALTNLARAINAIRFCASAYPPQGADSPSERRQRINALMCSLGFLHETMLSVSRIGRYFRHLPAFGALSALRKSDEARTLQSALRELRNSSVFHFDEDSMRARLTSFTQEPCVFASGVGDRSGDSYYELADVAAMQGFIGPTRSTKEWAQRQRELARNAARLIGLLAPAADELIAEGLASFGFAMAEGEGHPHEPLDAQGNLQSTDGSG
jgi:hypothetical protein